MNMPAACASGMRPVTSSILRFISDAMGSQASTPSGRETLHRRAAVLEEPDPEVELDADRHADEAEERLDGKADALGTIARRRVNGLRAVPPERRRGPPAGRVVAIDKRKWFTHERRCAIGARVAGGP